MITLLVGPGSETRVINAPDDWVEPGYRESDHWIELGFLNTLEMLIKTVGIARVLWHEEMIIRKVSTTLDADVLTVLSPSEKETAVRVVLQRLSTSLPNQMIVYPVVWAEPIHFATQDVNDRLEIGYAWLTWKYAGEGQKARRARLSEEAS